MGSAYSLGSDGVAPHEISVMCGEQPVIPIIRAPQKPSTLHHSSQKPSVALLMTIGGLNKPSGFEVESSAIETLPTTPLRKVVSTMSTVDEDEKELC